MSDPALTDQLPYSPLLSGVLDDARALLPQVRDLRRRIHQSPETGLSLPGTQHAVLDELADLDLQVHTGENVSSVLAVLQGDHPGPTVLLRGDMDALPVQEASGLDFASSIDGVMHACGHDTHVAMLAGAAKLLAARRSQLAGQVLFDFQPGEEGMHGARIMLEEGMLELAPPVTGAYALHIKATYPAGTINVRPGPQLASSDTLRIVVHGRGGHASAPHDGLDPVPVACEIVTAIQAMVTRGFTIFDPVVVTIAHIVAGTRDNVIPDSASMEGTIRTLSAPARAQVADRLQTLVHGIAAAHGATAEVEVRRGYPVTVNDSDAAAFVTEVAGSILGADTVVAMDHPVMGAEDFSYVLEQVPGAMAFLGACPAGADPATTPDNHSNRVVFDEDSMASGVAVYAALALRHLADAG
jgi:hippurate hydrolase